MNSKRKQDSERTDAHCVPTTPSEMKTPPHDKAKEPQSQAKHQIEELNDASDVKTVLSHRGIGKRSDQAFKPVGLAKGQNRFKNFYILPGDLMK